VVARKSIAAPIDFLATTDATTQGA